MAPCPEQRVQLKRSSELAPNASRPSDVCLLRAPGSDAQCECSRCASGSSTTEEGKEQTCPKSGSLCWLPGLLPSDEQLSQQTKVSLILMPGAW